MQTIRSKLIDGPDCTIYASDCSDLGQLAVADVRLSLQYEPNLEMSQSLDTQAKLVASHMRIAYSVPAHREYIRSGYPSEPILAEVRPSIYILSYH